ncbi:MAG: hypothetical protein ACUVRH_02970 [Candidatus Bipolaricaulia bacterium]
MARLRWLLAASLVLLLGLAGLAQTSQNTTVQATALAALRLTVDPDLVDFGVLTADDYWNGYKEISPAQTIKVWSNVNWRVNVRATTPTWSYTGTEPDPNKPCEDLEWKSSSTDPRVTATQPDYTGMKPEDAQVAAGRKGNNIPVNTHFRILLAWEEDPPGSYTLQIVYTLTSA